MLVRARRLLRYRAPQYGWCIARPWKPRVVRASRRAQPAAIARFAAATIYAFPDALPRNGTFSYFGEGHHLIVDGERTAYGWWVFWRGLSTYAALGATAGLMFWGSVRWRTRPSVA